MPAQAAGCAVLGAAERVETAESSFDKLSTLTDVRLEIADRGTAETPASPAGTVGTFSAVTESGDPEDYMSRTRVLVHRERRRLVSALQGLGCEVFPGEANFIFFSSRPDLQELLLHRGILIRSCDNYPGLGKGDYRIAVLLPDQNAVLLRALEEILRESAEQQECTQP